MLGWFGIEPYGLHRLASYEILEVSGKNILRSIDVRFDKKKTNFI